MMSEITLPQRIRVKNLCNKTLLVPASRSCVANSEIWGGGKTSHSSSPSILWIYPSLSAIIGGSSPGFLVISPNSMPPLRILLYIWYISLLCIVAPLLSLPDKRYIAVLLVVSSFYASVFHLSEKEEELEGSSVNLSCKCLTLSSSSSSSSSFLLLQIKYWLYILVSVSIYA
jgi:hypothetical protein